MRCTWRGASEAHASCEVLGRSILPETIEAVGAQLGISHRVRDVAVAGLWAPKGTPKDVIARINAAVGAAGADPAIRQRLRDQGVEPAIPSLQTPEAFGAFHKAEVEKWWPFIKTANIQAE